MQLHSIGSPLLWTVFFVVVIGLLAFDLGVFHRKAHTIQFREALIQSMGWIGLALIFNYFIYLYAGSVSALEFLTGYVVEKALSVDNLFVFVLIFQYFHVPRQYQYRVLFYGIVGALVSRGVFIFLGSALIQQFHWILYVFGVVLLYSGYKLLKAHNVQIDIEHNIWVRLTKKLFSFKSTYESGNFFVRENGKLFATPLLLVLVAIEATDIVFAVDSIPAIFAITQDPFIVFTSNIFAILGLRALYFLLEGAMGKFHLLRYGLAFILAFVGAKMLVEPFFDVSIGISLGVILLALTASIVLSLVRPASPTV